MVQLAAAAGAGFRARHGSAPVGVWSAPGRVNLIGEHTDYNGGLALPFAIGRRVAAALGSGPPGLVQVSSDGFEGLVEVSAARLLGGPDWCRLPAWSRLPLGVISLLGVDHGLPVAGGLAVHLSSALPVGAGLSSSAAVELAVAVGLDEIFGLGLDSGQLIGLGQRVENEILGARTGVLDQTAVLLGRAGQALLVDARAGSVEQLPLDLAGHGLAVLVADSGEQHSHAASGYADRRAACEAASARLGLRSLRELTGAGLPAAGARLDPGTLALVRHVVSENERVLQASELLRVGRPGELGVLLDASHESLRTDFAVSTGRLDAVVALLRQAGALGARMVGGGFGGSAIGLLPLGRVQEAVRVLTRVFAEEGWQAGVPFTVTPSGGPRREC